jgi:hypothetical protein
MEVGVGVGGSIHTACDRQSSTLYGFRITCAVLGLQSL